MTMPIHATPEEIEAAGRLHHRLHQTLVTALDHEDLVVRAVLMASIEFVAEAITPVALGQPTDEKVEAFLQHTLSLIWQAVHRNLQRHREQHQTP
jgi:hypothetical protein